jgi:hypothetical protein
MDLIRGESCKFFVTVYADASRKILANISGATIKLIIKKRDTDTDANALINKNGTILSSTDATAEVLLLASESNAFAAYNELVFEIIVKLADGSFIRSGTEKLNLKPSVLKTLF